MYSHNIPSVSWGLELHLFLKTLGPIILLYADRLEGPWLGDLMSNKPEMGWLTAWRPAVVGKQFFLNKLRVMEMVAVLGLVPE